MNLALNSDAERVAWRFSADGIRFQCEKVRKNLKSRVVRPVPSLKKGVFVVFRELISKGGSHEALDG